MWEKLGSIALIRVTFAIGKNPQIKKDKQTNKQTNKKPGMRWSNCMSKRQGRNSWLIDERD